MSIAIAAILQRLSGFDVEYGIAWRKVPASLPGK